MAHYYLGLALFGLCCVVLTALAIIRGTTFEMIQHSPMAVVAGVLMTIAIGYVCDDGNLHRSQVFRLWLAAPLIFVCGMVVGCLGNYFESMKYWSEASAPAIEFVNYFVKPAWWLGLIGIPASLIVGRIYSWGWQWLGKDI